MRVQRRSRQMPCHPQNLLKDQAVIGDVSQSSLSALGMTSKFLSHSSFPHQDSRNPASSKIFEIPARSAPEHANEIRGDKWD
jgi:hypothetical protein